MQVTVQYAAQLKQAVGAGAETFDVPAAGTVADVIRAVAERHGDAVRGLLLNGREVQPALLVFVGDRQADRDGSTPLSERDVLTIMTPISGG